MEPRVEADCGPMCQRYPHPLSRDRGALSRRAERSCSILLRPGPTAATAGLGSIRGGRE
jgi:hypothetical protein